LTSLITALITPGLSGDTETLTNVSAVSGTAGGADRGGHHVGQVIYQHRHDRMRMEQQAV
jgi:hypothetical protein